MEAGVAGRVMDARRAEMTAKKEQYALAALLLVQKGQRQ